MGYGIVHSEALAGTKSFYTIGLEAMIPGVRKLGRMLQFFWFEMKGSIIVDGPAKNSQEPGRLGVQCIEKRKWKDWQCRPATTPK